MRGNVSPDDAASAWEHEIRALEDEQRRAFLAADVEKLEDLWPEEFTVNSPLNKVLGKRQLLELLRTGRIRHSTYEFEIEHMSRHGDVVIVMGRDTVSDPPDGKLSQRRYTNIWRRHGDTWRSIARHANLIPGATSRGRDSDG